MWRQSAFSTGEVDDVCALTVYFDRKMQEGSPARFNSSQCNVHCRF